MEREEERAYRRQRKAERKDARRERKREKKEKKEKKKERKKEKKEKRGSSLFKEDGSSADSAATATAVEKESEVEHWNSIRAKLGMKPLRE